ncbi:hypothetical protein [Acinetobacter shaoyimingii]|uniref:Uncharacterized protein n=1 Tax=Acinetobacter shaoyimingii TaxID=2715164 RepID=A0A6G8RS66_9GAMM|nr:hypothetical protein [Acinetobacter shaoyimingii]NHB56827.1 hypothetical protein [Acinetobacter shaoyimingii]QIO04660.1 hypothetical protein G8E00_01140 [Acinetobacter shaoyimingii]
MNHETQGTEAIRAMITLRQCWFQHEDIYLNQGCLYCGSAATYLIYFTDRKIQDLMLDFIAQYPCQSRYHFDYLDIDGFDQHYEHFLSQLEKKVIHYSFSQTQTPLSLRFEEVESIFERAFAVAC